MRWIHVAALTGLMGAIAQVPAAEVRAQTSAVRTITEVELVASEGDRLELRLVADGPLETLAPETVGADRVIYILNSQLQLADRRDRLTFEQPAAGIETVTIEPDGLNRIRATIRGGSADTVPAVQVIPSDRGLALTLTPAAAAIATDPATADAMDPESADPEAVDPAATEPAPAAPNAIQIVVTATRTEEEIDDVPRSVTVIDREAIDAQTRLNRDLGSILSRLVPGLAPSTGSASIFGQSLRGRNLSVLIDGVPQSTSRNVLRDLQTIDPSAIERIEVLRGPTALYGDGATGGVVNIITRTPSEDGFEATTRAGIEFAPTDLGDSFGGSFTQTFSGRSDNLDYSLSASFGWTSDFFDGRGNIIPPDPNGQGGLADADTLNLFAKIGAEIDPGQRLQIVFNHFDSTQETDYTTDPAVRDRAGRQRAEALRGLELEDPQRSRNTFINLEYTNDRVFGGDMKANVYYRDYLTRFFPFDGRDFASLGNSINQSRVESERFGGRLQFNTPLDDADRLRILWGADYSNEKTAQLVGIMDGDAFDRSGGLTFRRIDDRVWSPPVRQSGLGLFTQANWAVSDRFRLIGGLRYENVSVDVDDFTTLAGNAIAGGDLNYDALLFNAGAVLDLSDRVNLFASFAQGFSLADVGLALRNAPAGFSVEDLKPEAQTVNHFEAGIRGNWSTLQASLVGFYNQSENGTSFTAPGEVLRAPERIYGIEAALDWQPSDVWRLGGTLTWSEGEVDTADDGNYDPLNGYRIAPLKLTTYVENETLPGWTNRLQLLLVGSRDRFENEAAFGQRSVNSYATLDFISTLELGPGTLELGIENLLDTDFFPIVSQLQTDDIYNTAGRGRTVRLGYFVRW